MITITITINGERRIKTVGEFMDKFHVNPHRFIAEGYMYLRIYSDQDLNCIDLKAFFETRTDFTAEKNGRNWVVNL